MDVDKFTYGDYSDPYHLSLTAEFVCAEFDNPSLRGGVLELIPLLLETGDLKYLTKIANRRGIYSEDTFLKQIYEWRIAIHDGVTAENKIIPKKPGQRVEAKNRKLKKPEVLFLKERGEKAKQCIDAVVEGFRKCLLKEVDTPPPKKRGAPRKKLDIEPRIVKDADEWNKRLRAPLNIILEEIQQELAQTLDLLTEEINTKNTRIEQREKQLKEGNISKELKKGIKADELEIKKIRKKIKSSLEKYVALKGIDVSDNEIEMLTNLDTTYQIAKGLLAIPNNIDTRTLENKLTEERKDIPDLFPEKKVCIICGKPSKLMICKQCRAKIKKNVKEEG